jgi:hypothetical protein
MKPYKPSNRTSIVGIALLVLTVVVGAVIGALVALLSEVIYLVLIFPIFMGVAAGAVLKVAVTQGKVRSPILAGASGLLAGFLMFGALHGVQYFLFRGEARETILEELGGMLEVHTWEADSLDEILVSEESETNLPDTGAAQLMQDLADHVFDEILVEETGSSGFWGYMLLQASEGVSIGRVLGSSEFNLGPTLSWVYWLAEMALAAGIAAYAGWQAAGRPFCEACSRWYGNPEHLGGVEATASDELLGALRLGSMAQTGHLLEGNTDLPSLEVHVQDCGDCPTADSRLSVTRYALNSKGKVTTRQVTAGMISPGQKEELMQALAQKRALAASQEEASEG